ncbi:MULTISPECIES: hypothetical protein [Vibrio]|uniref:hypothetical protein n=1 Tax=Vibrio TaxID=662 RepID=UPI00211AA0FD|nr:MULTISPECIES: hypothetical protein [Vibrio]MCQ9039843.1 hypothetical protein [Vibrio alginolyticus]MDK9744556.1 hypothetical protein [Vibrio sp. B516a]
MVFRNILKILKFTLIVSIACSIFWVVKIDVDDVWRFIIVLLCGISIPIIYSSSVIAPSFNFELRGLANKIPKPTAFIILPFLLIIPLGFQSELMTFFASWRQLFKSFQTLSSFFTNNGIELAILTLKLIGGGLYLLLIMIATQVIYKVVVDFFFLEKTISFSPEQVLQFKEVLQEHGVQDPAQDVQEPDIQNSEQVLQENQIQNS